MCNASNRIRSNTRWDGDSGKKNQQIQLGETDSIDSGEIMAKEELEVDTYSYYLSS